MKHAIKKYLTSIGAWFFMPIGGAYTTHGIPDIMACWQGRLIGIECKAPGKKNTVTALQTIQLNGIQAAGGIAILADSVEDLVKQLNDQMLTNVLGC